MTGLKPTVSRPSKASVALRELSAVISVAACCPDVSGAAKVELLMVVIALLACAVVVVVPALCPVGSDGGSCDMVAALRGGIRLANSERCQQTPQPADCAVTGVAGLERK